MKPTSSTKVKLRWDSAFSNGVNHLIDFLLKPRDLGALGIGEEGLDARRKAL